MTVFLVGAGPGDPGLITVRGAELLAAAEVVIYDRLAGSALLELAPSGAELIYVGKGPDVASTSQDDINDLLVRLGRDRRVVRLKGGDPYVFARGGEEAAVLADAGIAYEVVPGITSAIAVPSYGGVPVTKRYSSTSFTVVTGHEDPAKGPPSVDWESLAKVGGTIVILMGVKNLPTITERLQAGGLAPTTPVAAIRWGTRPNQQSVRSTLAEVGELELASPSVIVVGEVAASELNWFESRPLFGRKIVVTRAKHQASRLCEALRHLGADVVSFPTTETVAPEDGEPLKAAVLGVSDFDWVVFGSSNAVDRFFDELGDIREFGQARIAVIGPGTAEAVRKRSIEPDLLPARYVAEGLLEEFPSTSIGGRVLIPRAKHTRGILGPGLRAKGWEVSEVVAYQTVPSALGQSTKEELAGADAVAFASSSAARNFAAAVDLSLFPPRCAAIGPITAETARQIGFDHVAEAEPHTIDGLVDAIASIFKDGAES